MKLDKRIKDRNYIFDCFNAEDAKEYIGEDCYMTDNLELFDNLDILYKYRLDSLYDNSYFYNAEDDDHFKFCLPVSLVSELKEKTYRPYTFMEFTEKFKIGLPIKFRRKGLEGCERYLILNGYQHERYKSDNQTDTYIYIGQCRYTLQELFKEYEWQEHYTEDFEPFGVEE